jgi:hypothetical protein
VFAAFLSRSHPWSNFPRPNCQPEVVEERWRIWQPELNNRE